MRLVGFAGYSRAGKDTAARALLPFGWQRLAFADKLREFVAEMGLPRSIKRTVDEVGWEAVKDDHPFVVRMLVDYGTAARKVFGADFWIDQLLRQTEPDVDYVIPDVRHINEVDFIHQFGGHVFRITRIGVQPASEIDTLLDEALLPVITNNGTIEELHAKVRVRVGLDEPSELLSCGPRLVLPGGGATGKAGSDDMRSLSSPEGVSGVRSNNASA